MFELLVGVALIMGCAIPAALMLWLVMHVLLRRARSMGMDVAWRADGGASREPAHATHREAASVADSGEASNGQADQSP